MASCLALRADLLIANALGLPGLTKAKATAELKRYGARLRTRVGAG